MSLQNLLQGLADGKPVFIICSFIPTLLGNYKPDKIINNVFRFEAAKLHRG